MEGILATAGGVGLAVVIGVVVVVVIVAALVGTLVLRAWYKVARADEALIIVGKKQKAKDGTSSNVAVIRGGGAVVNPITQRSETLSLRARQIMVKPTAQSIQGVTVDVTGVALVKIGSTPEAIASAAERFVSQDDAIEVFTTEQLEGALRGVVATLTVEQLMRDRQELSDQIAALIKSDLEDQGLVLDSFQIQGITDQNGYIEALGAEEVSKVKRQAEIARINAEREIKAREIATSEETLIEQTAFDRNSAAAAADVGQARAEAEQAEALARAKAQQGVLMQEAENKQAELDADVKRVADAALYERQKRADADAYARVKEAEAEAQIAEQEARAIRIKAEADAEAIRVEGEAKASAIEAEAAALAKNQDAFLAQRALDALVPMMTEFAKGYANVGSVTVLSGAGGDGASGHLAGETAADMRSMFDSVRAATGVDLAAVIQGHAIGRGMAAGRQDEAPAPAAPAEPAPPAPEPEAPPAP
ncbi:SPFH domain-containing protein [Microbacterium sp. NPDC055683]